LYPKHIEIDVKFIQTNIILHFNSTNTQKEKKPFSFILQKENAFQIPHNASGVGTLVLAQFLVAAKTPYCPPA